LSQSIRIKYGRGGGDREKLLGVVGALVLRQVSLSKAAEIMGMGKEAFLELLDASSDR